MRLTQIQTKKEVNMKTLETVTPLLFSLDEAAALLKISTRTLWKLLGTGKVPCIRIGARRLIAYSWLVSQGIDLPYGDDTRLIDCREASRLLGISPRHLWRFTQSGNIPCRRLSERAVRYSIAELKLWINKQNKIQEVGYEGR